MRTLRKALPHILFFLVVLWAIKDYRETHRPIVRSVFAQANNTPYDTLFSETLTSATNGTTVANSFQGGQSMSRSWAVEYYSDGFSALSIQFETAPRLADGTAGSWTAVPNTVCSSSVQPPCVLDGANPSTALATVFSISAYAPFVRVNVTSVTGSGHIYYRIYGYKGLSARAGRSGGGGGSGPSGPSGPAGSTGATGATGPSGTSGAAGATGATGPSGATGASGAGASSTPVLSNLTAVTVNANTTSDQTLQEVAITAGYFNTLKAASILHGSGIVTVAALQTPTLEFKIKICTVSGCGSGTVVTLVDITSAATIALTNNGWNINVIAATSVTGASGKFIVKGNPGLTVDIAASAQTAAPVYVDLNTAASSAIDLTAALFIDFTVATSSGNTGNSITQMVAEVMPQGAVGAQGATGATGASGTSGGLSFLPSFTAPPSAGWTWDNQGSSTIDSSAGFEYLVGPAQAAVAMSARYRAVPAGSFTLTAAFISDLSGSTPLAQNTTSVNNGYGILVRDNGGKIVAMRFSTGNVGLFQLSTDKWTTSTSFSANYVTSPAGASSIAAQVVQRYVSWQRVVYNQGGNTLTWFWSIDGNHWNQFDQETATDFLANVTSIGFFGYVNNTSVLLGLVSWTAL